MPELPEVETMVRGIRPHVVGRRILEVRRPRSRYRPISMRPDMGSITARVRGQSIVDVRRLAKRILIELESQDVFVIEPRMTGLMLLTDPPDREHLRFEWKLLNDLKATPTGSPGEKGATPNVSLWFWDRRGLGTLRLYTQEELQRALGPSVLGPDALAMDLESWMTRLKRTGRPIKVALLDQKLVAGIGNLYASEILHLARIHPAHPSALLKRRQFERLHQATRAVLEMAIRYEGSTLSDGTYRNALNQNGTYQNQHRVYARAGELCPTCRKSKVIRVVQAQRSTFFCPRCQREPAPQAAVLRSQGTVRPR